MTVDIEIRATITEGKKITNKIIIGKSYTKEEWDEKEKQKWKEVK